MKTLVGKNNHLFLINDSSDELNIHLNNIDLVSINTINIYSKYINKLLLIVIPGKPVVFHQYLPIENHTIYRPGFKKYKQYINNSVLDTFPVINNINSFYKTDTHPNLLGIYEIYKLFIGTINNNFNLNINIIPINIEYKNCILSELNMGIGDLTWPLNKGDIILENIIDTYYYTYSIDMMYNKYIFTNMSFLRIMNNDLCDITNNFKDKILDWDIVSNNILYYNNTLSNSKFKSVIFCDSFIIHFIGLFLHTLSETYIIKTVFKPDIINKINPDYIFEFRAERFLR